MRLAGLVTAAIAGALAGWPLIASAAFSYPFVMAISQLCVRPGDVQTIIVPLGTGGSSVVHVVVTYPDGTRQHNIAAATGADGKFVYSWTVESNARAGISQGSGTVLMPHQDTSIAGYHLPDRRAHL